MDPQPDEMRREIEQTRSALTAKLGALGDRLSESVEETAQTVEHTVEGVRETVSETVDTVKHAFDLHYQVNRHPWLAMGGAVALGFVLQKVLTPRSWRVIRRQVGDAVESAGEAVSHTVTHTVRSLADQVGSTLSSASSPAAPAEPSGVRKLLQGPLDELEKIKEFGVEAAKRFAVALAVENLPVLVSKAAGLIDETVTRRADRTTDRASDPYRPYATQHNGV